MKTYHTPSVGAGRKHVKQMTLINKVTILPSWKELPSGNTINLFFSTIPFQDHSRYKYHLAIQTRNELRELAPKY